MTTASHGLRKTATPGLYEVFFRASDHKDEIGIVEGSGYSVIEGPRKENGLNFYWVERLK